jgi:hypothetical protein
MWAKNGERPVISTEKDLRILTEAVSDFESGRVESIVVSSA